MPKIIKREDAKAKQVEAMSQYGVPQEDIASTIGCCVETMQKLYTKEIEHGRAIANAKIGKRLFEKAMGGDTASLIFWAKARMGWRTTEVVDVKNSDGSLKHPDPAASMAAIIKAATGGK